MKFVVLLLIQEVDAHQDETDTLTCLINPEYVVGLWEGKATRGKSQPTTIVALAISDGDCNLDVRVLGDIFAVGRVLETTEEGKK